MPARVLVAEDEWLIAVTLRRQLESQGYEVVAVVGTGTAAVAACRQQEPDLVLMDIQMPEMDGLTATRTLMESCPHPVVVVTGNAALQEAAEEAGAMEYAIKPLLSREIPEVMTRAQRRFEWFMDSRREARDLAEAMPSWRTLLTATRYLQQAEGVSEERAFERLRQLADRDGRSLAEAAQELVSRGEEGEWSGRRAAIVWWEEGESLMTASPIPEDQRQRFLQVLQEIDSTEALEWCREAVEERLAAIGAERARCLHKGDIVEVTEGPLAGNRGQVTARSCHAQDMVLVQFDDLDLPEPLPIPAAALRRVAV